MHSVRINSMSTKFIKPRLILLSLLASACSLPTVNTDQYQGEITTEQASNSPVVELQRLATNALNQQQYDLSISFLQRAIKLEPRNPHSWHSLGQNYFYKQSYLQCLDMVQRSYSYSTGADDLDSANDALKTQCLAY
jgi:cytochrome c-type biogenesis protein CcmH/NrfG